MSEPIHIVPELLAAAAAATEAQSQDLFASNRQADAMVESAQFGWVGRSAAALANLASTWAASTQSLSARVWDHGAALRLCGLNFAEMECRGMQTIAPMYRPIGSP